MIRKIARKKVKKSDKKRILFFGDSNTAADGVSNVERFSDLAGKYFNAEAYNFGLSGSGTDQQYLIWKEYAQNMEVDLVVLGILVENIERNKVAYRETLHPYTKKSLLTPKPYFNLEKNKLVLQNISSLDVKKKLSEIDIDTVQWAIPKDQEFIYKCVSAFRENKMLQPVRNNFDPILKRMRSFCREHALEHYSKRNADLITKYY